jgi:hypothetical protein
VVSVSGTWLRFHQFLWGVIIAQFGFEQTAISLSKWARYFLCIYDSEKNYAGSEKPLTPHI